MQFVEPLSGHWQAYETAPVSGHEINGIGRDLFGRDHEVAFIFPVFIIDDDDHSAFLDLVNGFFNRCELHKFCPGDSRRISPGYRIPGSLNRWLWQSSG